MGEEHKAEVTAQHQDSEDTGTRRPDRKTKTALGVCKVGKKVQIGGQPEPLHFTGLDCGRCLAPR